MEYFQSQDSQCLWSQSTFANGITIVWRSWISQDLHSPRTRTSKMPRHYNCCPPSCTNSRNIVVMEQFCLSFRVSCVPPNDPKCLRDSNSDPFLRVVVMPYWVWINTSRNIMDTQQPLIICGKSNAKNVSSRQFLSCDSGSISYHS